MFTLGILITSLAVLFIVRKIIDYQNSIKAIRNLPGSRYVINSSGFWGILRGTLDETSRRRPYEAFDKFGIDVMSSISAFPRAETLILMADPVIIKEIMSNRFRFPKPVALYKLLTPYGPHILASEHNDWKRYRKVSAPAFTEPNNKLVWGETTRIVEDLFQNIWGGHQTIVYDNALEVTVALALFIIAAAGFGRRIGWKGELVPPPGHKLTFKDALAGASKYAFIKASVPVWALSMTERTRAAKLAYDELEIYMREMIQSRRSSEKREVKDDLLTSLIEASESDFDGYEKLSDQEVLGNIFIFLIAGHETTAHTLCFTLALLALHQDEQEHLYQELSKAFPDGKNPTYEDTDKLTYVDCVINETLRLFPPVMNVPKESAEDTSFVTVNAAGEKVFVPVAAGTTLALCIGDLHHNPRYWKDPLAFKPSRFLEEWPRDAFVPFSGGVRSCLGRRFAELENMVFLSMLVMKYKLDIKPEPEFVNETFEERRERVLKYYHGLTITPTRVPLVFTRRS